MITITIMSDSDLEARVGRLEARMSDLQTAEDNLAAGETSLEKGAADAKARADASDKRNADAVALLQSQIDANNAKAANSDAAEAALLNTHTEQLQAVVGTLSTIEPDATTPPPATTTPTPGGP